MRAHIFGGESVSPRRSPVWEDVHRTFGVEIRPSGSADSTLGATTVVLVPRGRRPHPGVAAARHHLPIAAGVSAESAG